MHLYCTNMFLEEKNMLLSIQRWNFKYKKKQEKKCAELNAISVTVTHTLIYKHLRSLGKEKNGKKMMSNNMICTNIPVYVHYAKKVKKNGTIG